MISFIKKNLKFEIKKFVGATQELNNSFKDILKNKINIDCSCRFNPKEKYN